MDFVDAIIEEYVSRGFGERYGEDSIRSLDDDKVVVSFDVEYDGDDVKTLYVFSDGTEIAEINNDDDLPLRLSTVLSSELNF